MYCSFPLNNPELLLQWITVTGRKDFVPTHTSFLCSLHFVLEDYYFSVVGGNKILKKGTVPSVFLTLLADSAELSCPDMREITNIFISNTYNLQL